MIVDKLKDVPPGPRIGGIQSAEGRASALMPGALTARSTYASMGSMQRRDAGGRPDCFTFCLGSESVAVANEEVGRAVQVRPFLCRDRSARPLGSLAPG